MREPRSSDVRVSIAEYLRDEDARSIRHEHLRGELYAVSGGTARHSQIAANIITHLHGGVRSTACAVYTSDFRVQPTDEAVYYPDVTVACGEFDGSAVVTRAPCLVVEITSRGTARIDRGEKPEQYRKCATLRTYLIVDQSRKRVTHYWRDGNNEWRSEEYTGSGSVPLPCREIDLSLDQIYEDIELPPLQVGERELDEEGDEYAIES